MAAQGADAVSGRHRRAAAYLLTGSQYAAEEMVQATLTKLCTCRGHGSPSGSTSTRTPGNPEARATFPLEAA